MPPALAVAPSPIATELSVADEFAPIAWLPFDADAPAPKAFEELVALEPAPLAVDVASAVCADTEDGQLRLAAAKGISR
jgi:hypothetical protein